MTSSPPARRFNWNDLGVRVASALVLIPAALFAVIFGGDHVSILFLVLVGIGAVVLGLEWGLISEPPIWKRIGAAVALGVLVPVIAGYVGNFTAAFTLLVFGAGVAAAYARLMKASAIDAAYGVLYIGWPCVVLVWLRTRDDGLTWTVLLFAVAWASDVSAYVIGNLVKGPKLWPRFSPNKTWSGFIGGLVAGVASAGGIIVLSPTFEAIIPGLKLPSMGIGVPLAMFIGLIASLATMAGDLWESALKRRFGVKDAGQIIPGHGGLLDRVDGMMFSVVAIAAARLIVRAWGLA